MDQKEFRGYWWPEEDTENKVPGILTFNPTEMPRLKLFSNFYPPNAPASGHDISHMALDMIHGVTDEAERVTMVKPRRESVAMRTNTYSTIQPSVWVCRIILEGYPYIHNKPALDQMSVEFYGQNR